MSASLFNLRTTSLSILCHWFYQRFIPFVDEEVDENMFRARTMPIFGPFSEAVMSNHQIIRQKFGRQKSGQSKIQKKKIWMKCGQNRYYLLALPPIPPRLQRAFTRPALHQIPLGALPLTPREGDIVNVNVKSINNRVAQMATCENSDDQNLDDTKSGEKIIRIW